MERVGLVPDRSAAGSTPSRTTSGRPLLRGEEDDAAHRTGHARVEHAIGRIKRVDPQLLTV
ncbi:MAG TPA: hypothetical protein VN520_39155 [Streptomyces sp.]|nr:hypothetical protein [Streptomyces sp.]HWU12299.1 hypothetical protein [Streptomyces sp.]